MREFVSPLRGADQWRTRLRNRMAVAKGLRVVQGWPFCAIQTHGRVRVPEHAEEASNWSLPTSCQESRPAGVPAGRSASRSAARPQAFALGSGDTAKGRISEQMRRECPLEAEHGARFGKVAIDDRADGRPSSRNSESSGTPSAGHVASSGGGTLPA